MADMSLILDSARGVYIPQGFAEMFGRFNGTWSGVDLDDLDVLFEGPDHEWYWESWDNILNNAEYKGVDGVTYHLHQDGDVWLIPEGMPFPGEEEFEFEDAYQEF